MRTTPAPSGSSGGAAEAGRPVGRSPGGSARTPPGEREVRFPIEGGDRWLTGVLRLPAAPNEGRAPAALLLAGSGPIDRDGNATRAPIGIQRALAEALAATGIASFRFDRRGISDGTDWREATFGENTRDARDALAALAQDPGIDPTRLVVVGHSEGALHALRLAVGQEPPSPAAVALLSVPARRGDEVLLWQAEQIGPSLPPPARLLLRLTRADVVGRARSTHDRIRRTTGRVARIGGARMNVGWFREFLEYDPRPDLARLHVPTLAVTGGKDLQTPPEDLAVIADLVPAPVTVRCPGQMTHLLRDDPSEPPSLRDYKRQLRQPVDRGVLHEVATWVVGALG